MITVGLLPPLLVIAFLLSPDLAHADDCAEAAREVERGEKQVDGSREEEESFRRAIQLCPDLTDAHFNLGLSLAKQLRFSEAEAAFLKTLSLVDDTNTRIALGNVYAAQKLWPKASEHFEGALKREPQNARALQGLAVARKNLGDLVQAEELLRQAIQSDPKEGTSFYNLGVVLEALGREEEAVVSYQTAIEKLSNSVLSYVALGSLLLRLNRLDESVRTLKNATFLDPKNADSWRLLSEAYEGQGEYALSLSALERASLQGIELTRRRAILLVKSGRGEEGLELLQKAQAESPQEGSLASALGWAYLHERRFTEAKQWLERALQLNQGDAFSHNNLGALLEAQGDREGAKREFQRARELNTRLESAKKNLERVN